MCVKDISLNAGRTLIRSIDSLGLCGQVRVQGVQLTALYSGQSHLLCPFTAPFI